jgi:hypothetical protein
MRGMRYGRERGGMDIPSITTSPSPAPSPSRRGFRELWAAYQQRMAYGQPLIGIHAWPFLDWRTASGLQWRTRINPDGDH